VNLEHLRELGETPRLSGYSGAFPAENLCPSTRIGIKFLHTFWTNYLSRPTVLSTGCATLPGVGKTMFATVDQEARADWLAQQLKEKEAIINGISDALMVLDGSTYEILEVNQAFLTYYGVSRDEVLGKHCYEITHHLSNPCHQSHDYCPCPLADTVTTGNESRVEHAHKSSDGQTLYSEITAYPLKDVSGQVTRIIHLTRDITQRKRLEFQLREREKLNGILELAGGASHEMNQPLTVIITGLERLIKRLSPGSEIHEFARLILDHARRLTELSRKLASITRYASKEYVGGTRILDLDRASDKEPDVLRGQGQDHDME